MRAVTTIAPLAPNTVYWRSTSTPADVVIVHPSAQQAARNGAQSAEPRWPRVVDRVSTSGLGETDRRAADRALHGERADRGVEVDDGRAESQTTGQSDGCRRDPRPSGERVRGERLHRAENCSGHSPTGERRHRGVDGADCGHRHESADREAEESQHPAPCDVPGPVRRRASSGDDDCAHAAPAMSTCSLPIVSANASASAVEWSPKWSA